MAVVPEVPLESWRALYAAASEYRRLEPWDRFEDSEIFGVRDPATGEMGYACILGALGEVFALCVYRGAEGFDAHRRMQARDFDLEAGDLLSMQNCLMAEFADRDDLEKADREAISGLGLKFRGRNAWPLFRSYVPGYVPWHLTAAEAALLTVALRAACEVVRKADGAELDLAGRQGEVFCCFPGEGGVFETRWEPLPVFQPAPRQPVALDAATVSRLKAKTLRPGGVWEADAPYLPMPVGDSDRPYVPRSGMVVDRESMFIINGSLSGPEKPAQQVVADAILESIEKSGRIPEAVHVRGPELARLLAPLSDALGIRIEAKERLEGINEIRGELEDSMSRRHGKEPEKRWDHRAMEKVTSNISRRLKEGDFESPEEANRRLRELQESGELDETPAPNSAQEAAQDLMYQAFELADPALRVKLARRALKISPDCADAYVLLAEETAGGLEQERELYQKAVEAGSRALGEAFFKENAGHFWGAVESRPYMRARSQLARCLWELGDREAALGHWREMLKLNTNDNQGLRYVLLARLGILGRFDEVRDILSRFEDDCGLELLLMKALAAFEKEGPSASAVAALRESLESNEHFPDYLLGTKPLPRRLPDQLTMGGESEAVYAVSEALPAWKSTRGAMEWLSAALKRLTVPKAGRNEPCPCGSGKKYKKCCAV